jgi:uncharacterized protein (DUF849 family)
VPVTAEQIARDAVAVRDAGAGCLHVHPRSADGTESLAGEHVREVVEAVQAGCPGFPVGVTTAAWIEPDVSRRLAMLHSWTALPAFASVNLSEEGALEVIDLLNALGVGVEAGVWTTNDAHMLVENGLDDACVRVLVEVDAVSDPDDAVRLAAAIDLILDDGLSQAPRLHHGAGVATWSVMAAAIENGHDVRVGLEDTLVLGDRSLALNNAVLVSSARSMAVAAGRWIESGEQA